MSRLADRLSARRKSYEDEEEFDSEFPVEDSGSKETYLRDEEDDDTSPLAIVNEIKRDPSQKGTLGTVIGGVPVDLHVLEDYLVKTSPFALKTVMRYHNARNMEEIKNYSRGPNVKMNSKTLILILLMVGMAVLGLFLIMFLPDILATFQGGI